MTHGSLFSGIGGFDLAAEWMGWENKFHCEWNPFGQRVLKYYWPKAELFTDITKSDFTKYANKIDVLTGGFPCQPYSQAGKRLGKEDDRHLWPQMCRAIREIQPRWVVGENVYGLVSWNGGLVFHEVQSDLEAEGYEVFPFLLPACSVNAPHRRDRIWFVAYCNSRGLERSEKVRRNGINAKWESEFRDAAHSTGNGYTDRYKKTTRKKRSGKQGRLQQFEGMDGEWNVTNSNGIGVDKPTADTERIRLEHSSKGRQIQGKKANTSGKGCKSSLSIKTNGHGHKSKWENFPTVSPLCTGDDGLSDRLDSITFSKWRNESIKAGGNAIVPQVVFQLFKAIQEYEDKQNINDKKD